MHMLVGLMPANWQT